MNICVFFLYNFLDVFVLVVVIVGGMLIIFYDLCWVDFVIIIGIVLYILYFVLIEIGGLIWILMLGSLLDIDNLVVIVVMWDVDGVMDVYYVYLW